MAEGGDDSNIPDIPENADQILFVEDLIRYLDPENPPNCVLDWDPVRVRELIHNVFDQTFEDAINFLENTLERDNDAIFIQMQNENLVNSNTYERFAENLARRYFSKGFDAKFFLIYCVNLFRIAGYFRKNGVLDAVVLAKKHILKFLGRFNMLNGGWDTVHRTAENYAKMLNDYESIPTPQSQDSDESDPQTETNSDESSTCLSEEQSVSSENEDYLKEHQERACSIKERFLKKPAQCSSESSNDIDSLEEPKFPPGDSSSHINFKGNKRINISESMGKLRAGTSKDGKESFVDIKSDCRKKMDLAWNDTKRGISRACIEGNELIDEVAPDDRFCPGPSRANKDSSFLGKIDCREKLDRSSNVSLKDNEKSETLNFEEEKIDNSLLDDGLRTEISSTAQISPHVGCKRKHDLSPDEENSANSQSMSSGGNNFNNKFEPNKKLVFEKPNFDNMPVSSNIEMDFSPSKESNATSGSILPTDEEESPELMESHLKEGLSSTSSDEERSPSGDGNL